VADAKPRLVAVPPEPGSHRGGEAAAEPAPTERKVRRRSLVLVLLLAVLLGIALAVQSQRAARLGAQIDGLTAELGAARAEIAAHERRMVRVRASVDDLEARISDLGELVDAPPEVSSPPETP
jgi:cell division protein FtsB